MKSLSAPFRLPLFQLFFSLSLFFLVTVPRPATAADLVSISSRLVSGLGDDVIVTEFIIQGSGRTSILLRGLEPSLSHSIPDALENPTMTLFDARGRVLDANNDWVRSPDREAIEATNIAPPNDREPAILHTFSPGLYTTVVRVCTTQPVWRWRRFIA